MILRAEVLEQIREGRVTLAFRRWRRPSVRSGGTLLTSMGQVHISDVTTLAEDDITEADAYRAGYASRDELLDDLNRRSEGAIYRVAFAGITPDPRIALRETLPDEEELPRILQRLDQLDSRSEGPPWTKQVLALIAQQPAVLAEVLAGRIGMEKYTFKQRVRKLKALGLTISLERGYRLSPRGEWLLERIADGSGDGVATR